MVPGTLNRAYADDLAMVLRRGLASLPALHRIFIEFAAISRLHISIGKTVLAPLHPFDLLALRAELSRIVPD